ncbi:MAG: hypothetical protein RJA30_334 [Actinomycetota bacterium]
MTAHFKKVSATELGYAPEDVDHWIDLARQQFANPASHVLDAATLRTAQFRTVKGGYQITAVDAALDRLDDAFADQEVNRLLTRLGHQGARERINEIRELLLGRIARPKRQRFDRQPWRLKGYSVRQVDAMLAVISAELEAGGVVTVAALRQQTFSPRWAGYTEAQVDAFLDRFIQYLQLSRALG